MKKFKKKILLLGEGAVGKTSLVRQFVEGKFSDEYIATIGANIKKKELSYPEEGMQIDLMIADLIGQQGYENTQRMNMMGANGALMITDITRYETLDALEEYWIPLLKEVLAKVPPIIFFANKSDLIDLEGEEAKKFRAELLSLAEKYRSKFYLSSAKTGENVEEGFRDIGLLSVGYEAEEHYGPDLYDVRGEINSRKFLDLLQSQLYMEIGSRDFANSIIKKQTGDVGLDIRDVTHSKEKLQDLVDRIKDVEKDLLPTDVAERLHRKRKGLLNRVKD